MTSAMLCSAHSFTIFSAVSALGCAGLAYVIESGSSRRKENPLPASSWYELQPRSKRTLSIFASPSFCTSTARFLKFAATRCTFGFAPSSASPVRSMASESRSKPTKTPFAPSFSAIAFACPAPPKVASTTTSSFCIASCSIASCKRTVRCAASRGCVDDTGSLEDCERRVRMTCISSSYPVQSILESAYLAELLCHSFRILIDTALVALPAFGVPDLDSVGYSGKYDPLSQSGKIFLMIRNKDAACAIDVHFRRTREHKSAEPPRLRLYERQRLQLLRDLPPRGV